MTIQAPTRITIEVHQPDPDLAAAGPAIVHVFPEPSSVAHSAMAATPREDQPVPAAFDPGECRCLDAEDCNADHAND